MEKEGQAPTQEHPDCKGKEGEAGCVEIKSTGSKGSEAMTLQASSQAQLRQFVERIERLQQEQKALAADVKDIYSEAKAIGFDVKAIRKIVMMRRKSSAEREEEQAIIDLYAHALGMLADLPLGEAAIRAAVREAAE
jgi:uncharacterized protein (UPF0335 family)